ncbi:MAG: hypothetical protein ABIH04_00590 [Planctomycetota bacterium]
MEKRERPQEHSGPGPEEKTPQQPPPGAFPPGFPQQPRPGEGYHQQPPPYSGMPPQGQTPPHPREPLVEPEKIWGEEIEVGKGFFDIVPRLLRARERMFADIRDNKADFGRVFQMAVVSLICFVVYGALMGLYNPRFSPLQSLYGGIKLPLVFLGTLIVCLLPFYIINIFIGLRLRFRQIVNLFMTGVCSTSIVALCLAPIAAFFMLTVKGASRYHLIFLINVVLLAIAGFAGLVYISRAIRFLACHYESRTGVPLRAGAVLKLWMLVYIFVGIQLAWELRPYMVREGTIPEGASLVFLRDDPYDFYSMIVRNIGQPLGWARSDEEEFEYRLEVAERNCEEATKRKDNLLDEIEALEERTRQYPENARIGSDLAEKRALLKEAEEDIEKLDEERREVQKALDEYQRLLRLERGER